jgi:hypothetical protein
MSFGGRGFILDQIEEKVRLPDEKPIRRDALPNRVEELVNVLQDIEYKLRSPGQPRRFRRSDLPQRVDNILEQRGQLFTLIDDVEGQIRAPNEPRLTENQIVSRVQGMAATIDQIEKSIRPDGVGKLHSDQLLNRISTVFDAHESSRAKVIKYEKILENISRVVDPESTSENYGALPNKVAGLVKNQPMDLVAYRKRADAALERAIQERLDDQIQAKREIVNLKKDIQNLNNEIQRLKTEHSESLRGIEREVEEKSVAAQVQNEEAIATIRGDHASEINDLKEHFSEEKDVLQTRITSLEESSQYSLRSQRQEHETALKEVQDQHEAKTAEAVANALLEQEQELFQREKALLAQLSELDLSHKESLASQKSSHEDSVRRMKKDHKQAMDQMLERHRYLEGQISEWQDKYQQAVVKGRENLNQTVTQLRDRHEAKVARIQGEHKEAVQQLQVEHRNSVEEMQNKNAQDLRDMVIQNNRLEKQISEIQGKHENELGQMQEECNQRLEQLRVEHEKKMATIASEHMAQVQIVRDEFKQEEQELYGEIEKHKLALQEAKKDVEEIETEWRRKLDEQKVLHENNMTQLEQIHAQNLNDQELRHRKFLEDSDLRHDARRQELLTLQDRLLRRDNHIGMKDNEIFSGRLDEKGEIEVQGFGTLSNQVQEFTAWDWREDRKAWPNDTMVALTGTKQNRLKKLILGDLIWTTLFHSIFCSPFRLLGKAGEKIEEDWNKNFGEGMSFLHMFVAWT